jgi:DHA2 family multidrug resistance protein
MFAGSLGLSQLTTLSGTSDLFWPMLLRGASLGFLFIPLTLASLGGLRQDQMGVGSGMINLTRQLGGSVGIAALSTALNRRLDFHRDALSTHVSGSSPVVQNWLAGAQANFVAHGFDPVSAHAGALALLQKTIEQQSIMLSFDDCFLVIAAAFLCTLPLIGLFRKGGARLDTGSVH